MKRSSDTIREGHDLLEELTDLPPFHRLLQWRWRLRFGITQRQIKRRTALANSEERAESGATFGALWVEVGAGVGEVSSAGVTEGVSTNQDPEFGKRKVV